jgi:hypothetical protein
MKLPSMNYLTMTCDKSNIDASQLWKWVLLIKVWRKPYLQSYYILKELING